MLPAKREGERERKKTYCSPITHAFLKHSVKPNKAPTHPQYTCTLVQRIFALIWRDGRDILLLAKGIHYTYVPTSSCAIHPSSPLVEISPKSPPISILYFTSLSLSLLLAPNFDLYCPQRALCCVRTRLEEAFCFLLCSLSTFLAWVFTRARPLVGF